MNQVPSLPTDKQGTVTTQLNLKYTSLQVVLLRVPCPSPITSPAKYNPESVLPQCTAHRLAGRPLVPQFCPVVSECIHWSTRVLWNPEHHPPEVTPTLCPPYTDLSFLQPTRPPVDENPPTLWSSLLSPQNYCSHILVPYAPPIYRESHGPLLFILFSSAPLRSSPRIADPSTGCDACTPNSSYYTQWCGRVKERHPQVLAAPH